MKADQLARAEGLEIIGIWHSHPDHPARPSETDRAISTLSRITVNAAPRELLVRIPGIGVRSVDRMLKIRRWSALRLEDLRKLRVPLKKCLPFVITADHNPAKLGLDHDALRASLAPAPKQLELVFVAAKSSAISGEV